MSHSVATTIVSPSTTYDTTELFKRAQARYAAGNMPGAAELFEQVAAHEEDPGLVAPALFHAGLAREAEGALDVAAGHFVELASRCPTHPLRRDALLRALRLLAYLERWADLGPLAERLAEGYAPLGVMEAIVVHSSRALALLRDAQPARAAYEIEKARRLVEAHGLQLPDPLSRDVAQLYFAIGELRRLRGREVHFSGDTRSFLGDLERRCQWVLDAQAAYAETLRAHDAHWAAMAGYQMASLYEDLHTDLLAMPPPASADTPERRSLFGAAMRLRYSILLTKGRQIIERVISMAERTGHEDRWVHQAREASARFEALARTEELVLSEIPFTRAQLMDVLRSAADHPLDFAQPQ